MLCCNSILCFSAMFMSRKSSSVSKFWLTTYKYYKHASGQHHYKRISAFEMTYCTARPRAVWAMHSEVTAYLGSLFSGEAKSSNRNTQRSWPCFSTRVSEDPFHWWSQQAFFLQEHWFQMVLDRNWDSEHQEKSVSLCKRHFSGSEKILLQMTAMHSLKKTIQWSIECFIHSNCPFCVC